MQRVIAPCRDKAAGGHRTRDVAGFEGKDDIPKIKTFKQPDVTQRTFRKRLRDRAAMLFKDILFQ